jgi:hypothetical protein
MVSVPAFLLRRLYVKGSLSGGEDGFSFRLRNSLGSGYAHKLQPLTVDGGEIPLESSFFVQQGERIGFFEVSKDRTFALAVNTDIEISVDGVALGDGPHKIGMGFDVPGMGTLRFDFTDEIK